MKQKITLEELQSGSLFIYNGQLGFKSEYRTGNGAIEAYCYGSGEMFWGGTKDSSTQSQLLVMPIDLSVDNFLDALALYENTKRELEDED